MHGDTVILNVILPFFIFFFKQKTAYEIRIRDWSSDVCSSDLNADGMAFSKKDSEMSEATREALIISLENALRIAKIEAKKIGRASCRERV